jgi:hypothetical protein
MDELTDRDRALIDIFGKTWTHSGMKALAIKDATGLTPTAATTIVNALLDTEAALAYAPLTVKRLRRLRARRQQSRTPRRA